MSEPVAKPGGRRGRMGKLLAIAVVLGGAGWFGTRVSPDPESLWEKSPGDDVVCQGRHRLPLARMGQVLDNRVVRDLIQVAGADARVNNLRAVVEESWLLRRSVRDVVWTWGHGEEPGRFAAVAWVGWRTWIMARALADVPGGVKEVDGALVFRLGTLPAVYQDGYLYVGRGAHSVPPQVEPIPVDGSDAFAEMDVYDDVVVLGPAGVFFAVDASQKDRLALKQLLALTKTATPADNELIASWLGDWPAGAWLFPDQESGQELGRWIDGRGTNSFFTGVFDHDGPGALVLGAGPSAASQFMFDTPSVSVVFRVNNRKRSILHAERFFQRIDANGRMGLLRKEVPHAEVRLIGYQATKQGYLQFRDEDRFAYGVTDDVLVIGNSLKVVRQLMARTWPKEAKVLPGWYREQVRGGKGQDGCLWMDAPALAEAGQSMVGAMRVANVIEANPEYEGVIAAWERFFQVLASWNRVEGQRDGGWNITIFAGEGS